MSFRSPIIEEEEFPQQTGDAEETNFTNQLPDNCVEYLLFSIDPQVNIRKQLAQIENVRKSAIELAATLTKDYIWQKDEFNLTLKNENGLVYLHGITDYSDAVEDEWLIVYILRELSKSHPNLWIRVFDTDGEFLLVEAANVLPRWLNPEIDNNRAWINKGNLLLIPVKDEEGLRARNLELQDAVQVIKTKRDALVHSGFVEAEAFYRLEKYPGQISESLHHSIVTMPRKLAYILHSLPKSVAPAVEEFYLRDPIALKRVISPTQPLTFPPEDLITVSVRFSKVLFAQLRSQRFDGPPSWSEVLRKAQKEASSGEADKVMARLDIGMKLTCGFEILAAKAEKSKSRVVRELAIELEDLAEDGNEALPSDEDIKSWKDHDRDDSEAWMDINYQDFEKELDGKRENASSNSKSGFGDANTQSDLRKIVSRFEAFLNDDSAGMDGAELDEMDYDDDDDDDEFDEDSESEDKEVSFDEEEFAKMMREMMGLPSAASSANTAKKAAIQSKPPVIDEEDEEIQKLTTEFEAELNEHGALKLDPVEKQPRLKNATQKEGENGLAEIKEEDENSEDEVDIDYNLAKNLLESFKSQAGMAGPTGNLLGMMGFQLPRDEEDENEKEDEETGNDSAKGKGKARA
ncbi:SGT1 protein-domain-containing protein [Fusarium sp. MPI-SDFR-AT-0072]|uniref:Protein ecdysoneless-like protein n=1 Tax=Fusarium oxysporum f. sp. rapae TaxID=485398 RepID=A0A8J5P0A3_FUSOX|nr:Protein ecdysoneless-like protein [Fusarium oxysporum f. sp. rapae]KAH7177932.1 SGT1 protein-domain-containing protein [Fusarium sp. MPI-SDFR-AT-0072]